MDQKQIDELVTRLRKPASSLPGCQKVPPKAPYLRQLQAEGVYLGKLAASLEDDSVLVEIGRCRGGSTALLALCSKPKCRIVSIEISSAWEPYVDDIFAKTNVPSEKCTRMTTNSRDASKNWEHEIDLLFIDGDHSYQAALADLTGYTRFVRKGGHILVHDIIAKGVRMAVKKFRQMNPGYIHVATACRLMHLKSP